MTSTTLFREGTDLDALLAELDAEHPGQVQVVDVEYGRAGGFLGFFAHRRVSVRYRLIDTTDAPATAAAPSDAMSLEAMSLDDLLAAADAAEAGAAPSIAPRSAAVADDAATGDEPGEMQVEFARMLLELATAKAAERQAEADRREAFSTPVAAVPAFVPAAPTPPIPAPVIPAPVTPAPAISAFPTPAVAAPAATFVPPEFATPATGFAPPFALPAAPPAAEPSVAPADQPDESQENWGEYAVRRRLIDVGVPVEWIPEGAEHVFQVVKQLCRKVPSVRRTDPKPDDVIVVAGLAHEVLPAARALAIRLQLRAQDVYAAGCGGVPEKQRLDADNAGEKAAESRARATAPLIVAVALDGSDTESAEWDRRVVSALAPNRLHVVVDAGRKTGDVRRTLSRLPSVRSLFVTGAASTASPASVWELGVPIEMLDDRRATPGVWAALLIDALAALDAGQ